MHTLRHPRIALHALGCKLNQAELQELAIAFESRGFAVVGPRDDADAYFVNTCTVTAEADRKARQWLRMVRRSHPRSLIVACGCGVERAGAELAPLADLLISNGEKDHAVDLIMARMEPLPVAPNGGAPPHFAGRTRSLLKVQEGCATPCTYCIVPYVRRGEHSVPVEEVLAKVRCRIDEGYREIVLTGTRVGAYRDGQVALSGLLQRVLVQPGLQRLRVSSLQPQELSAELLRLWRDSRLCRHFHLSLQSGSRTVLERMHRRYDPEDYAAALEQVRTAAPGAAITTDVIVGFPGETEEEFADSVAFCESIGFARIHVFPYSRRPGTPAAGMAGQVPGAVVRQRVAAMEQVAERGRVAYASSWLGGTLPVLWEGEATPGSGVYSGTSDNYLRLLCRSDVPLQNVIEDVLIERLEGDGVWVRR